VLLGFGLLVSSKVGGPKSLLSDFTDYCFPRYLMFKCRKYSRISWTRSMWI
jgi:hypothetical protein